MQEKARKQKEKTTESGGPFGSGFDNPTPLATIESGVYKETLPAVGMSVGEIRRKYADKFDLDANAVAIINGKEVGNDVKLGQNEHLKFIHKSGEKG